MEEGCIIIQGIQRRKRNGRLRRVRERGLKYIDMYMS
jgi:hypothetical protein